MKEAFQNKYFKIEKNHFWFKSRRKYILQLLEGYSKDKSILDIGCSSGILLDELREIGFDGNNLYGIDISPKAIQNCKENGIQNSFIMDAQNIELEKKFDIVVASDCLEHLEDDEKALKNWHGLLNPGGSLYLFVPAFMTLWSEHDVENMHFRRYTRNTLKKKLYKTGFEIEKSNYWNFCLFLPILTVRLFSRLKVNKKQSLTGEQKKLSLFNNLLFNLINFENKFLKYINFPFGVSTYIIARKASSHKSIQNTVADKYINPINSSKRYEIHSFFIQHFIFTTHNL